MNFADITDISIPQWSVDKITDSLGRVLWEKPYVVTGLTSDIISGNMTVMGQGRASYAYVIYQKEGKIRGDLTNEMFVWTSSNPAVVTILEQEKGFVSLKACGVGSATVTCSIRNGLWSWKVKFNITWHS